MYNQAYRDIGWLYIAKYTVYDYAYIHIYILYVYTVYLHSISYVTKRKQCVEATHWSQQHKPFIYQSTIYQGNGVWEWVCNECKWLVGCCMSIPMNGRMLDICLNMLVFWREVPDSSGNIEPLCKQYVCQLGSFKR